MAPIILIDANNLLHRYFHGPTSIGKEGRNVNAVRGIAALVDRLWRMFSPAAIVAVFDAGDSGRRQIFAAYKAHREGTPPELVYQIGLAQRWLPTHYQTDVVRVEGYEADDVIVTLAGQLGGRGIEVIVVTNDKDLTCIVHDEPPRVTLYGVAGSVWSRVDEAAVMDRLGVPPTAVVDYLALCGDASDGVPGVPGIGPKTAAILLRQHGTLDAVLENIDAIERPRWRELLTEHRDAALTARQLLAPVAVPLADVERGTTHARRPPP